MSFTVTYRGLQVECKTIEDLNRLAEESESIRAKDARKARRIAKAQAARPSLFEPDKSIRGLVKELKDQQRTLLTEISKAEKSDAELRALLRLPGNKALAGVFSGISKAAKRLGLESVPIERKMTRSGSGEREYRYSIHPEVAEEVQKVLLNGHA
jgi:glutamyl-tRNA reductase